MLGDNLVEQGHPYDCCGMAKGVWGTIAPPTFAKMVLEISLKSMRK